MFKSPLFTTRPFNATCHVNPVFQIYAWPVCTSNQCDANYTCRYIKLIIQNNILTLNGEISCRVSIYIKKLDFA